MINSIQTTCIGSSCFRSKKDRLRSLETATVKSLASHEGTVWCQLDEGGLFVPSMAYVSGPVLHVVPRRRGEAVLEVDLTEYVEISLEATPMDPVERCENSNIIIIANI